MPMKNGSQKMPDMDPAKCLQMDPALMAKMRQDQSRMSAKAKA